MKITVEEFKQMVAAIAAKAGHAKGRYVDLEKSRMFQNNQR